MPTPLLDRCRNHSVREFQLAAAQRFRDGVSMAESGRRTGSIYVWGYAAEMLLKSAYFSAAGFADTQMISMAHLHAAAANAASFGVIWPGKNLHDLVAWAELLTAVRAATPALAYNMPGFDLQVLSRARAIRRHWRESLRYYKNIAYVYEINQVRDAVSWLLTHSRQL